MSLEAGRQSEAILWIQAENGGASMSEEAKAVGESTFITAAEDGDEAKRRKDENLPRFSVILTGPEWTPT